MTGITKDQFRNDSGGVAGAIVLVNNNQTAIAVQPGDVIWLSEEEQAITANAPRRPDDNPFINGTFTLMAEAKDIKHARPLRPIAPPVEQEVGAAPTPVGVPPQGQRAPAEEVGTPVAVEVETEVAHDGKTIVKKPAAAAPATKPAAAAPATKAAAKS